MRLLRVDWNTHLFFQSLCRLSDCEVFAVTDFFFLFCYIDGYPLLIFLLNRRIWEFLYFAKKSFLPCILNKMKKIRLVTTSVGEMK